MTFSESISSKSCYVLGYRSVEELDVLRQIAHMFPQFLPVVLREFCAIESYRTGYRPPDPHYCLCKG